MGLHELLKTLRDNERKQIDSIWQEAREQADSIRTQVAEAIAEITREHEETLASACRQSVKAILAESESAARKKKLLVYRSLEEVLRRTARDMLPELRRRVDYAEVFAQLAGELPELQWERIIVNPVDLDLAAGFFNREIVRTDASVSGGLLGICSEGRITIDNTLEKRLARRWDVMLPGLIKTIENKYVESRSAEKN